MSKPPVVTAAEWQAALDELRTAEKRHTRHGDALAAARRRLPMVAVDHHHLLEGESGEVRLGDLFESRQQLIVYHFMFGSD